VHNAKHKQRLVTLRRRADFNALFNRTEGRTESKNQDKQPNGQAKVWRFYSNETIVLARRNIQPNNPTYRFGIVASKKVGKAVQRNKVRRRIKEVVRTALQELGATEIKAGTIGLDIVIIAKPTAAEAAFCDLRNGLDGILKKLIS